MIGGLRANLVGALVASTGVLVLTLVVLEEPLVEYRESVRGRGALAAIATTAAERLEASDEPDALADALGSETASRVLVLDREGVVIGDTGLDGADIARARTPLEDGERERIMRDGTLDGARNDAEGGEMFAARRTDSGRVVIVSRPMSVVRAERESIRELLIVAGVLAVLLMFALAAALSRTFAKPIEELTRAADALAAGDLSVRVRSQRIDELGRLGRSLDRMADQLEERLAAVRAEGARLRVVLDGMVEAVFVTDRNGQIVMTNRAIEELLAKEVRGRTVVEAVRSTELLETVWAALDGETSTVEFAARVGDDDRTLVAQVAPLPEAAGVVAVLHDVTDLKRADRVRRDFVANASHELRTPLTAIRGFAETLRDGAMRDPDTSKRFLDTILKHTTRLQRLVNDLLALSRAESTDAPVVLRNVDVISVAEEVVSGLEAAAAVQQIHVVLDAPDNHRPLAIADEWALDQVLVNLVDNALKYGSKGGQVTVRIRQEGELVTLEVEDDGAGIPAKYLERIFERFYRVDKGRTREVGGTGLGLAIVKHLVQGMNAEISVRSRVGHGSVFRVEMKAAQSAEKTLVDATSPG